MNDDALLKVISQKLSLIAALQMRRLNEELSRVDQVALLDGFSLPNDEIAMIVGTSKNTVEVIKSRLKKVKPPKSKK
jgi:hypothetical protein